MFAYGALGETRTPDLCLRRAALYPLSYQRGLVPKVGFEPTRAYAHYALNVARLPFRHFGAVLSVYMLAPSGSASPARGFAVFRGQKAEGQKAEGRRR